MQTNRVKEQEKTGGAQDGLHRQAVVNSFLEIISQMGRGVLSDLKPAEALHRITAGIGSLLPGVRSISILLKEGEDLVFAAVGGDGAQVMEGRRLPGDTPILLPVLRDGRPICIRNAFRSSVPFIHPTGPLEFKTQTVLASPLKVQDEIIGAVVATFEGNEEVGSEELSLLDSAAIWAAVAITSARQRTELLRKLQESQAIQRISQALNSTLELDLVFKMIVDVSKELIISADGAVIHLLDNSRQTLKAVAVAGQIGSHQPGRLMKVGEGIAGQVLAGARLINVADLNNDPRAAPSRNPNLCSLLVAPVAIGSEPVGTISIQSSQRGAFNEADEHLMMILGNQAGLAIKNARLFQNEHEQRVLSQALEQTAVALNRNLDLELVLDNILAQVAQVVPCQNFNVMLIQGQQVQVVREWDQDRSNTTRKGLVTVEIPFSLATLQKMITSGQPLLILDTQADPLWEHLNGTEWIRSYIGVPLKVGELTLGFLNADSEEPNFFSAEIVPVLQSFAAHAAIAIQNARLVQDLQNALKQEKSLRVQLTRADRLATMGMITASVAHEINNPIQAVLGCLELAQMDALDRAKQLEYLAMAKSELVRLAGITKRVLNYQRPSAPQSAAEPVNLSLVVEDVLALAKKKLQHARIEVITDIPANLPLIMGSANELKQVFLNMVLNAVDAMGVGGQLRVSVKSNDQDRNWLQVIFSDTGEGMTPEIKQRIFEPFFSTKEAGTGLGLWVSRDIVAAHNGKITLESTAGVGTTFTIWLPY